MSRTGPGSTTGHWQGTATWHCCPCPGSSRQLLLPWVASHFFRAEYRVINSSQLAKDYLGFKTESPVFWKPSYTWENGGQGSWHNP